MEKHIEMTDHDLKIKIRSEKITFAGNLKLKIYRLLTCFSGKTIKRENKIFFIYKKEALENKYRPCGHCMKEEYKLRKSNQ